MNKLIAILKRDFWAMISSPKFLLLNFLCTAFWSVVFIRWTILYSENSLSANQPGQMQVFNIHSNLIMSYLSWVNIFLLIVIPVLMMGFIAEERRNHTFEFLMTSPVSGVHIILGKFFAGFSLALVVVGFAFCFPLILSFFNPLDFGALLSSFLGFILMVAIYCAASLFASSVARTSTLAVILGVVLNLSFYLASGMHWDIANPVLSDLLLQLDVISRVNGVLKGELSLSAVVSALSVCIVFLFLSERMLESERWR